MLKRLDKEEFARRTAHGRATPVFREYPADRETPVAAFSRLAPGEDAFLLESVAGGESRARYSFIGLEPRRTVSGPGALDELRSAFASLPFQPAPELPGFQGGAVGFIAYDAAALFEPKSGATAEPGTPPMQFLLADAFLVFDNVRDTVTVAVVAGPGDSPAEAYGKAVSRIEEIHERLLSAGSIARLMAARASADAPAPELGEFECETSRDGFRAMVAKCKAAIEAGEIIQAVPSQKFTAKTSLGDLALYRALRMVNPSPYNFLVRIGGRSLVGSSPEELVKLQGRTASTAPIAGTRPRGDTPARDAELERELAGDPKELAEHTMLVDLGRNDLGRVCEAGSVKAENFAHVERFSHVMHLVTNVRGTLAPEYDAFDLVKSVFPAGTLSGAPKVRAMQLVAEMESSPRGIYGGAAGYFSFTGDMDFAIVIRTMILENGTLTMRSGAGIVADSDPDREYDETVNKAKAVFEAARFAKELA